MSGDPSADGRSLSEQARYVLHGMWRDMVSVYYANTFIWRVLKSGALLFLGLFCWVGANLTLSYVDWGVFRYVMAYGFALLFWGPFTHLVVVPLVIRLRRTAGHPVTKTFSQHGSKINLTVFFLVVVVLANVSPGLMAFEFQVDTGGGAPDVTGTLECTTTGETIECRLANPSGVDHVAVLSDGREVKIVEGPPFEFEIPVGEVSDNGRQFVVELRDAEGGTLRRFVRSVDLIGAG